jgi:hypothetical protein
MHRLHVTPAALAVGSCIVIGLSGPISAVAGGATLTPLTQQRTLSSFVIVPPCGPPSSVSDDNAASDFLPFDSLVHAEHICDFAQGIASADQQSSISDTLLAASGSTASVASAAPIAVIHAISGSTYLVSFQIDVTTRFSLGGELSAEGAAPVVLGYARVRLEEFDGGVITETMVEPAPNGRAVTSQVSEVVQLQPGVYTLRVDAGTVIDSMIPPSGSGTSTYDIEFTPLDPADLDGDGDVDGIDLALLLGAWGGCPLASVCGCPADLDCSGVINGIDLAMLLAAWG